MASIRMSPRIVWSVVALILVAAALLLFSARRSAPPPLAEAMFEKRDDGTIVVANGSPLMTHLAVAPVTIRARPHGLDVPATVQPEPNSNVAIRSPVAGQVVESVLRPGDAVRRGEVLALISSGDFGQAQSDVEKAKAQLSYEEKAVRRAKGVLAVGGNAEKDLDSARNDYAQAQAQLRGAQQRLDSLGERIVQKDNGRIALVSPVDGVVASTTLAVGSYISDTTAVQLTLIDLSEIWVEANVPEGTLASVQLGQAASARFEAYPGLPCSGPIFSLDPTLRLDTRRLAVRLACANPDLKLRPNMFATVTIAIPQPPDILVPKSALLMNNDAISVFVETAPRTYKRRPVTVSYDEGDDIRVLSGLKSDERVLVSGGVLLNDD